MDATSVCFYLPKASKTMPLLHKLKTFQIRLIYIYKSQTQNLCDRITPEPLNRFGRKMSHWNQLIALSVFFYLIFCRTSPNYVISAQKYITGFYGVTVRELLQKFQNIIQRYSKFGKLQLTGPLTRGKLV